MDSYPLLPSPCCSTQADSLPDQSHPDARARADLACVLSGAVEYDVLRAVTEGDIETVQGELRRLRRAIDRAERLIAPIQDTLP